MKFFRQKMSKNFCISNVLFIACSLKKNIFTAHSTLPLSLFGGPSISCPAQRRLTTRLLLARRFFLQNTFLRRHVAIVTKNRLFPPALIDILSSLTIVALFVLTYGKLRIFFFGLRNNKRRLVFLKSRRLRRSLSLSSGYRDRSCVSELSVVKLESLSLSRSLSPPPATTTRCREGHLFLSLSLSLATRHSFYLFTRGPPKSRLSLFLSRHSVRPSFYLFLLQNSFHGFSNRILTLKR